MPKSSYYPLKKGSAQSETSFWINLAAFVIATGVLAFCRYAGMVRGTPLFILFAVVITLSIVVLECIFYPHTCVYRKWKIRRNISWRRVFYKEVTFLLTIGIIGFFYWLLPMYDKQEEFAAEYLPFLKYLVPFMLICSVPYFAFMDKIDEEPDDIYYRIGDGILHFKKTVSRFELGNYARSWLVKAFWLSLMQPYMVNDIYWFLTVSWEKIKDTPVECFWAADSFCFFIDLAYASTGYLVNLKILNSQTRTAEPTLFGWIVAVMCYWPFWGILFYPYFFDYNHVGWMRVFQTGSVMWWTWFALIIFLEFMYSMATIAAGIRFSNLTYRGLWNTGPYKYTKHPAYVYKNISWWLIAMPFMATGWQTALKLSLLLLGNNIIYYFRAKTEERHLSHYPEYVTYALEMNKKSIFRGLARVLPFLKYKAPTAKERIF